MRIEDSNFEPASSVKVAVLLKEKLLFIFFPCAILASGIILKKGVFIWLWITGDFFSCSLCK